MAIDCDVNEGDIDESFSDARDKTDEDFGDIANYYEMMNIFEHVEDCIWNFDKDQYANTTMDTWFEHWDNDTMELRNFWDSLKQCNACILHMCTHAHRVLAFMHCMQKCTQ